MNTTSPTQGAQCPNCAYELSGLSVTRCPECGAGFRLKQVVEFGDEPARSWIVVSAVMLVVLGIVGILPLIYSIRTIAANARHDYVTAKRHSRTTCMWIIIGFILGIPLMIWVVFG